VASKTLPPAAKRQGNEIRELRDELAKMKKNSPPITYSP